MKLTIQREGAVLTLQAHVPHGPDASRIAAMVLRSDNVLFEYSPDGEFWDESKTEEELVMVYRVHGLFGCSGALAWAQHLPRDIAFILEHDKRSLAGNKADIDRGKLAPYPVQYLFNGTQVADFDALEIAMREPDSVHGLGMLVLSAPTMRVSDPCYEKGTDSAGIVTALPGNWVAETVVGDTDWYRRVKVLRVRHDSVPGDVFEDPDAFAKVMTVSVDSGQCGFFDDAAYPEGDPTVENSQAEDSDPIVIQSIAKMCDGSGAAPAVFVGDDGSRVVLDLGDDDDDEGERESGFYADCCRLTADVQLPGGGVLTAGTGAVSLSGFGDGGYAVKVLANADGLVVAAVLEYLVDNEDEGND